MNVKIRRHRPSPLLTRNWGLLHIFYQHHNLELIQVGGSILKVPFRKLDKSCTVLLVTDIEHHNQRSISSFYPPSHAFPLIRALYPGLVYERGEPMFFSSISNHFVLRCFDGMIIDGKPVGLSKTLFNSTFKRINDPSYPFEFGDREWLTIGKQGQDPVLMSSNLRLRNFLNVGQIINNAPSPKLANVRYQELNIPSDFPLHLRHLLPNLHNHRQWAPWDHFTRVVLIVSTRPVKDEELFSTYNEIVS